MRPSTVSFAATLIVVFAMAAGAQDASPPTLTAPLERGDRLTIALAGGAADVSGRLVEIRGDQIRLRIENQRASGPDHTTINVPMARIRQIDLERHDSVTDGGIFGALFVAACFKWWCRQGMSESPPSPWIGAGLGALVGGAIDHALYRQQTVFVVPSRRTRRLALSYTLRF